MTESNPEFFGDLPGVERTTTRGLSSVRVRTADAKGLVFLQGAHVAEWLPTAHSPVIWMSEQAVYQSGKALRGGIPVCFPWFGAHAERKEFPAHGFARIRDFEYRGARLDDVGRVELEFALEDDHTTRALFPYAFQARLRIAFGKTLGLEFSVTNRGAAPFSFEEALHSYFHVGDVRSAAVLGLQGSTYVDKVRGMAEFSESEPALRLNGETDRVYTSSAACEIVDPIEKRTIRVEKSNSQRTVIWNPWAERAAQMADFGADAWPRMLCVESANVAAAGISLAPGDTHTLRIALSLPSPS